MISSLNSTNEELTSSCNSAKAIWDKLVSTYEQSSSQRVDRLLESFFSSEKMGSESIVSHIARLQGNFNELNVELRNLSKSELPEIVLMGRIMSTLPSPYFEFKSVWESVPIESRTINNLTERLRLIEMRLPSKESKETNAFLGRDSGKKKGVHMVNDRFNVAHSKGERTFKCYKCKGENHYARNCPNRNKVKQSSERLSSEKRDGCSFMCNSNKKSEFDHNVWVVDTGATQHMTHSKNLFISFKQFDVPTYIHVGNRDVIKAYGHGDINVEMRIDGKYYTNHLKDVWYVPDVSHNLFSVSQTLERGHKFYADKYGCKFFKNGLKTLTGRKMSSGLYILEMKVRVPQVAAEVLLASSTDTLQLWHERLCHQNKRHVKSILKQVGVSTSDAEGLCEGCIFGKHHRDPFHDRQDRAVFCGEYIHADVCGPFQETSIGGSRYFLCFKDDYSKFRRVFFLKHKSEVANCLSVFLSEVKTAGHTVKEFVCDGGGEFINAEIRKLLEENGISLRMTIPYTPQQNGVAERENRTLVEAARSMIHAKNLPLKLWAEAVNTAAFVLNRTGPTGIKNKSPIEIWKNCTPPRFDYFKIFGTKCYAYVPQNKRRKLDKKSTPCLFVGYTGDHNGYRLWNFTKNSIELSRDVIFERELPMLSLKESLKTVDKKGYDDSMYSTTDEASGPVIEIGRQDQLEEPPNESVSDSNDNLTTQRHIRERRLPSFLANNYVLITEKDLLYNEALKSEEKEQWKQAMLEELKSLAENDTWDLVELPQDKKVIDNRWVLKVKRKPNGDIERYKARLVAKGYSQKEGVDFEQTFSPVARFETVRTLLNLAASEKYQLGQFDVQTAFLYGSLSEEVYMHQPRGFDDGSGRVCRLKRSLYGLKQSPRCWNQRFVRFMRSQKLEPSKADPCLFIQKGDDGRNLMVAIYVDDGIIVGDKCKIDAFLMKLRNEFKITIGSLESFLGMQIEIKDDGSIFVHQESYTKNILSKFNMLESNPVSTPSEKNLVNEDGQNLNQKVPYRQAVGSLLYLSMTTRPDISFSVSRVSEVLDSPKSCDWEAVKRIFKYLNGTQKYGLLYTACTQMKIRCFTDSDFANDVESRRSRTGVVTTCGSGAITWVSRKQPVIALSTTEAEYIAASEGTKEMVWLNRLVSEITTTSAIPTLYVDNRSTIRLIQNPEFHRRTKHIEVRFHFVREKLMNGDFVLEHVPSREQLADMMTKSLPSRSFEKNRESIGVLCLRGSVTGNK